MSKPPEDKKNDIDMHKAIKLIEKRTEKLEKDVRLIEKEVGIYRA